MTQTRSVRCTRWQSLPVQEHNARKQTLACRVKQLPLSKDHEYAQRQNQQNARVLVVPPSKRECFIQRERAPSSQQRSRHLGKKKPGLTVLVRGSRIAGWGRTGTAGLLHVDIGRCRSIYLGRKRLAFLLIRQFVNQPAICNLGKGESGTFRAFPRDAP